MNEKTAVAFYDHISLLGKRSILISYVYFKHFQNFSRTFTSFSIFQAWKFVFSFPRFSRFAGRVEPLLTVPLDTSRENALKNGLQIFNCVAYNTLFISGM